MKRQPGTVEFRFATEPGIRERCIDLATHEAACCPFLGYHPTADDNTVTWATSGDEQIEAIRAFLDMFENAPAKLLKTPGELGSALERLGFRFVDDNEPPDTTTNPPDTRPCDVEHTATLDLDLISQLGAKPRRL